MKKKAISESCLEIEVPKVGDSYMLNIDSSVVITVTSLRENDIATYFFSNSPEVTNTWNYKLYPLRILTPLLKELL